MRLIMLVEDTPEELPIGVYDSWGEAARTLGVNEGYLAVTHKRNGATKVAGIRARIRVVDVEGIEDYQKDGKIAQIESNRKRPRRAGRYARTEDAR